MNMKSDPTRRKILSIAAATAVLPVLDATAACPKDPLVVCNVTHLASIKMAGILKVSNTDDIQRALNKWSGSVSVGGGRFSMGGQTAIRDGLQLDMRSMNRLVSLDPVKRTVRVQAGMRWRELQQLIDPHGLSVQTMQSYSSFTVGGSLSVNCHGRYIGHGPVSESVRAIQLVLPDGEIIEANRQSHSELFSAAIGGYGGVGMITEVEMNLDENFKIERSTAQVQLQDYPAWFKEKIQSDSKVLMHNADLIAPTFDKPRCITWSRSDKNLTTIERLRPTGAAYAKEKLFLWAMTELPDGASLREKIVTPLEEKPAVVWRNYEASLDVKQLEPASRSMSTYVLQEYFVPERNFFTFAKKMSKMMRPMSTGTLNVSIRHSPADQFTLMSWAKENVFSFVVYYKQGVSNDAQRFVGGWTRSMIDLAVSLEGTYYLPYQLHATLEQFRRAYPQEERFRKLRQQIGASRLTNTMWSQYQV